MIIIKVIVIIMIIIIIIIIIIFIIIICMTVSQMRIAGSTLSMQHESIMQHASIMHHAYCITCLRVLLYHTSVAQEAN